MSAADGLNVVSITDKLGRPISRRWTVAATITHEGARRLCTITGTAETATAFCQLVRRTHTGADITSVWEGDPADAMTRP